MVDTGHDHATHHGHVSVNVGGISGSDGDKFLFAHRNAMLERDLHALKSTAIDSITECLGCLANLQQDLVDKTKLVHEKSQGG